MTRRIRIAIVVLAAAVAASLWVLALAGVDAVAQGVTVPAAAPVDVSGGPNVVNVGQLLAPWLQILMGGFVAFLMAILTLLTAKFNKKANLENNASALQIEAHFRDALQSALTNAAGKAVMELGNKLNTVTIDARTPAIANAVKYMNGNAVDAVEKFGLSPVDVAEKVIAKIGVLTAGNPDVTPSTIAANVGPAPVSVGGRPTGKT